MSIKNIHFILVRPQMGENIGSVARAIKNFNITKLRIVNPRCDWPNQKALATSVGAKDILKSSKIYNSLESLLLLQLPLLRYYGAHRDELENYYVQGLMSVMVNYHLTA